MKRWIVGLAFVGTAAALAFGQDRAKNWLATTAGQRQLQRAFTVGGLFGVPRYATASLPTCDATQGGAVMYDSTTKKLVFCNETAATTLALIGAQTFSGAQTFGGDLVFGTQGRFGFGTKTLADAVATAIVRVSVAQGAGTAGVIQWGLFATNATDHQAYSGEIYFSAVNKAGTETCADPTIIGTALLSASLGTLTCTYACDETPTDAVDITLNCNTSLNVTLEAKWMLRLMGAGTITAQ